MTPVISNDGRFMHSVHSFFTDHRFRAAGSYLGLIGFAALFVLASYVFINTGDLIHDYGFHLARIVGLAQSIAHGDWLPNLAYVFEGGIGYASPMFYGNWQFYLPALVYLAFRSGPIAYAFFIFLLSSGTACSAYWCAGQMQISRSRAVCFALACVFGYSWFGYGMTMVLPFVPLLFCSMYRVLYENQTSPVLLGVVIALLIQTHILSTFILAMMSAVFVLLNIRRLTLRKCGSFLLSSLLGLLLSSGYLFQYFEQTASQTFFFNWTLRDYPFSLDQVARGTPILEILSSPSQWILLICYGLLLIRWTSLSSFSRQLLVTATLFFLAPTTLLPWDSVLRYTFLAILQDPRRLSYFCALLVYLAAAESWNDADMKWLTTGLAVFYVLFCLIPYFPSDRTQEALETYDTRARLSIDNPQEDSFGAIGDEYFTIGIVHKDKSDGILSRFQNPNGITISNLRKDYNLLEFDYELPDERGSAGLLLPEIFYKGYVAEYSNGAGGSQPQMLTRPFSNEELEQNRLDHKPEMVMRTEYNGQIYLQLNTSGHVRIVYRKTAVQIAGYWLEGISWSLLGLWLLIRICRHRNPNTAAVFLRQPVFAGRRSKACRPDSLWAVQKSCPQGNGISVQVMDDSGRPILVNGITVKKDEGCTERTADQELVGFRFPKTSSDPAAGSEKEGAEKSRDHESEEAGQTGLHPTAPEEESGLKPTETASEVNKK